MAISLIEMEHDANKHRWVLWRKGNYIYEVENRQTGLKVTLDLINEEDSLAVARAAFKQCVDLCKLSH